MTEYEFSPAENARIERLRERLLHCSVGFLVLGLLLITGAHLFRTGEQLWVQTIAGAFFVVLGVVFMRPLNNLRHIVSTEGNDVRELMMAMDDLRVAFSTSALLLRDPGSPDCIGRRSPGNDVKRPLPAGLRPRGNSSPGFLAR